MKTRKFMQTLDTPMFKELTGEARKRGINLQTLLRAVAIPDWWAGYQAKLAKKRRRR